MTLMGSRRAVCVRCGAWKPRAWTRCRRCKLDPRTEATTLAKSMFLSLDRFDDPALQEGYRAELAELAIAVAGRRPVAFDPDELVRLERSSRDPRRVPAAAAWGAVLRTFLPALLFLALLWGLVLLLRLARS